MVETQTEFIQQYSPPPDFAAGNGHGFVEDGAEFVRRVSAHAFHAG
jgi:hypothetical protein